MNWQRPLTFLVGGEEDAEATPAAALVGPHPDHAQRGHQHHVVGHRGAELVLQVLHGAAAVVHRHKVPFALVGVGHLVVQETQVDLRGEVVREEAGGGNDGKEFKRGRGGIRGRERGKKQDGGRKKQGGIGSQEG